MTNIHHTSARTKTGSDEWRTPTNIFDQLNEEFYFEIDGACSEDNKLCPIGFTEEDNSLSIDWGRFGSTVWLNPPYSKLKEFCKKAKEQMDKGVTTVMLIPARTDTVAFHDYIAPYAEIRFIKGRLKFLEPDGKEKAPAPFPSMIAIFGNVPEVHYVTRDNVGLV